MRRAFLFVAAWLAAGPAIDLHVGPATAQAPVQDRPVLSRDGFVRAAHSSAALQARAAELAATRETRPEAKSFAQEMVAFRREQIRKLEAGAAENKSAASAGLEFEHQVLIENLEPLDFLALSRRYAELQVQALESEVQLYAGAANSPDEWVKSFAGSVGPALTGLLDRARGMQKAVGP